jgi:SAM-dependent methyltransferase
MSLALRSTAEEEMDAPGLDLALYQRALSDLAALNRFTRTHQGVLAWLERCTTPGGRITLLDIACGHGDLLRSIAAWAAATGRKISLTGIDLNPRSALARGRPDGITYLTGDIFAYAPAQNFDFIVTSQFTHHLPDADVVRLIRWMNIHAIRGWCITDLHRHWFPYYGFPLLARLMRWHRIVRQDGTISIARGFTAAEWRCLLAKAGVTATVRWQVPFRHVVTCTK